MRHRLRLTANRVTLARIFLLPVPCALLLYGESVGLWTAFVLYTLLGATDFVDGLMARREGPTKLGGLIDPVADKIFIASICLALTAIRIMPAWVLAAIMLREFLMTALRSSVALRQEAIQTSVLAKIKTMVQMGGFGTIFLTLFLPRLGAIAAGIALFLSLALVIVIYRAFKKRKAPYWVLPVALAFLYWTFLSIYVTPETSVVLQLAVIVALTWISGVDYLLGSLKIYARTGINMQDISRLFWALSHTLLVAPWVEIYPQAVLLILASMSFELALGGIDTVVASETRYAGTQPFLITGCAGVLFAALAFLNHQGFLSLSMSEPAAGLMLVSVVTCALVYRKWQGLFRQALGI